MCLHLEEIPLIPDETVRVAKAAFPKGNLYMRLRDELGILFQDEDFASVYPLRGQPAQAPWRLAMVLIMQFLENLSDRQAASSVRARIDWKYALSLELTDSGFDFSVLSEFRDRLISGGIEQQILDKMLSRFQELKLLSARGKLDARNSTKRTTKWTGYKVHLTESCDEDVPSIITHVITTPATSPDQTVIPSIHQALAEKELLPEKHLVDQGYTSAQLLSNSQHDYDIDLFGRVPNGTKKS